MLNGYKVCVVISAGRPQFLEVLIENLKNHHYVIDEIRFWANTINDAYVDYMYRIASTNPDLYKVDKHSDYSIFSAPYAGALFSKTACDFYHRCMDENTVYVKFDDDIVYIEEGYVEDIARFAIEHKDNLLSLGNVVNNCISDFNHKKYNGVPYTDTITETCMCPIGWGLGEYVKVKHDIVLENIKNNTLDKYRFPSKNWKERFSLNSMAWLGENMVRYNADVDSDDEVYLTELGLFDNILYGNRICVHYAFFTQWDFMKDTNYLNEYKQLVL